MNLVSLIEKLYYWNRKFHIYIGLFLLFFIWLFSFSGLLLNHSQWKITSFWDQRKESVIIAPVKMAVVPDSSSLILNFMNQLKISGEVSNIKFSPGYINFRVIVPGTIRDVHIDLKNMISRQKLLTFNFWGKIRVLHSFNGIDKTKPDIRPNWIVTRIWRAAMDGIALGLIFLCISSWLMWYKVRKNYAFGIYLLILGFAGAFYFIFIVRFL